MIIFDLDGTLADCEHRRHLVEPEKNENFARWNGTEFRGFKDGQFQTDIKWKPDWDAFYEACNKDVPIWPVVRVIESICLNKVTCENVEIQIWSGRSESVRDKTIHWLKYILGHYTYSQLKMRPINDNTPDDELKEKWLDEALAQGKTIEYVFDDRPKVIRMWRRRGIFVFNCNQTGDEF